jgi:3-keto-L-gulonate-6-phosphate decarboxylase
MSFTATCLGAFAVVSVVIEIGTPLFVYSGRDGLKAFKKEYDFHRNSG